jgi:hypothetical protein
VPLAPFIAAALLTRACAMPGFERAFLAPAVSVAATEQRAGAVVTRMLTLAAAGVPLAWHRDNTASFPAAFREVVRTLLLCRARHARLRAAAAAAGDHAGDATSALQLDDATFDAVVARLARLDVWPTFRACTSNPGLHEASQSKASIEDVSVFDFECKPVAHH